MNLYKKKTGKCWFAKFNYIDENGHRKQKSISTGISKYDSKKKALEVGLKLEKEYLKEIEAKKNILTTSVNHVSHSNDTIEEYSEYWLDSLKRSVKENTLNSYREIIEGHINPIIGQVKLSDLDQFVLQAFIMEELSICDERQTIIDKRMAENKNAVIRTNERPFYNSIKKHLDTIKMMLEYAVNDGEINENVAKKINKQVLKMIPNSKFEPKPYDIDEINILKEAIKGDILETPVVLASTLGLRRSEILGLKWSDIDFSQDLIYIRNTCVLVGATIKYRDNVVKTDSSKDMLPLIPELKDFLLKAKERQETDKEIMGSGYTESDYICRWPDGKLIKPNYISQAFKRFLSKNGLRPIRFHDLRHSVGTIILEKTGDIKLVSEILRHSTIQTTSDIYIQTNADYKARGLNALSNTIKKEG